MEKLQHKEFSIQPATGTLSGQTVSVKYAETTDGAPYYICQINGNEIQLRKDEKWELMWGNLNHEDVEILGNEINKHIEQ